jgi:hypothetical protein
MRRDLILHFADALVFTEYGMTWAQVAKFFQKKSIEYRVTIPFGRTIFPFRAPNPRVGFIENMKVFSHVQQLILLKELCYTCSKINNTHLKETLTSYINDYTRRLDNCNGTNKGIYVVA